MEAPLITDNALDILKQMSSQEVSVINLLQQLVLKRPAKHLIFLNILLEQTSHHTVEVSFPSSTIPLFIENKSNFILQNSHFTFYFLRCKTKSFSNE